MGISSILLVVLFLQASLGVEWNPDGSCKSSILYSHFTASSDISRPLQHLRDIHHIRHEQQCSGSCITEQGCRVFHYDKEKMVCSLFTDNGPITLDNYYVVNTTQDYRTFLRHADCPYYTECKFDPYCQNDCLDKENFTCECPTNKHGKTCLQDFQHIPELVQTIPVHYGVNGEHMTINGKHYLIIASRSTKSCCWTYDAGLSKVFVYEEVLEKYVHMQNLLPSSTADLQGFVTEGTHYLITTAYEDLPGIAGGSSNAFGNPTDNTLYKFEDTEAIFPEIVAINADQKLTYMVKIGGSWEMHESETCCMMAATVHPSGNLVGITTGRYIQSKPTLDSPCCKQG
ncbi:uncharacterized protein LOC106155386 [Lingula anatina]|uniref:Uncharacterized protein LOC106155386 n=1 Tax=Lingula anatina TaxID=7574 RepID=A0A1S3HKV5_LINAN|nr:uncharacterized protein LOC106155386 [Lingula anatina]|eukprot:XP_013385639.1 uncharacterized protein LOC106155386 [Lingula anatina]